MKSKLLVLALVMLFALNSNAQIPRVSFGIRAGINLQNLNATYPKGDDIKYDMRTDFHVGVNAEIHIVSAFYIQPGVLFNTKGAKQDKNIDTRKELKIGLSYIEVPINILYKPVLGPGKLLLGFGPYVAYAVGGKIKSNDKVGKVEFEKETTFFNYTNSSWDATYYARRLDVGGNLLFGYEFAKKIAVQLNAQLGMVNIESKIKNEYGSINKSKAKNTGFGVSIGYRF